MSDSVQRYSPRVYQDKGTEEWIPFLDDDEHGCVVLFRDYIRDTAKKVCVWVSCETWGDWNPQCGSEPDYRFDTPNFCSYCGGKVEVKDE